MIDYRSEYIITQYLKDYITEMLETIIKDAIDIPNITDDCIKKKLNIIQCSITAIEKLNETEGYRLSNKEKLTVTA